MVPITWMWKRFGIEIVKEDKRNEKPLKLPSQSLERNMQFGKKKGLNLRVLFHIGDGWGVDECHTGIYF
jgi:hypothetical protein